jgi:Right handed beta helix region
MNKTMTVLMLAVVLSAAPAQALSLRTFVSGHGSDGNNCSFVTPCRSFATAFANTVAGGEIYVLDTSGYGPLTIDKAISIVNDGVGTSSILVPSGGIGITINAGANDAINLRGLNIEGGGTGATGITFNSGKSLTITNCVIRHVTVDGIDFVPDQSPNSRLAVSRTIVSDNGATGIFVKPFNVSTAVSVTINNVEANNNTDGIVLNGTFSSGMRGVVVVNTIASGNSNAGINADSFSTMPVMLDHVVSASNGYGVISQHLGSQVVFYQTVLTGNTHGWVRSTAAPS